MCFGDTVVQHKKQVSGVRRRLIFAWLNIQSRLAHAFLMMVRNVLELCFPHPSMHGLDEGSWYNEQFSYISHIHYT